MQCAPLLRAPLGGVRRAIRCAVCHGSAELGEEGARACQRQRPAPICARSPRRLVTIMVITAIAAVIVAVVVAISIGRSVAT